MTILTLDEQRKITDKIKAIATWQWDFPVSMTEEEKLLLLSRKLIDLGLEVNEAVEVSRVDTGNKKEPEVITLPVGATGVPKNDEDDYNDYMGYYCSM